MTALTVRCKMRLVSKMDNADPRGGEKVESTTVRFLAVQGEDNKSWSKWTPNGALELTVTNQTACAELVVGREYFLDVVPAP